MSSVKGEKPGCISYPCTVTLLPQCFLGQTKTQETRLPVTCGIAGYVKPLFLGKLKATWTLVLPLCDKVNWTRKLCCVGFTLCSFPFPVVHERQQVFLRPVECYGYPCNLLFHSRDCVQVNSAFSYVCVMALLPWWGLATNCNEILGSYVFMKFPLWRPQYWQVLTKKTQKSHDWVS